MSIVFDLKPIVTENKPGELINVSIKDICRELDIEFEPNNQFYINKLNSSSSRGNHSNNNVNELLLCLSGSFEIKLFDGKETKIVNIKANQGVYIPKNIWIEYSHFENCIIFVFVELLGNNKECIYNIEEYKRQFDS